MKPAAITVLRRTLAGLSLAGFALTGTWAAEVASASPAAVAASAAADNGPLAELPFGDDLTDEDFLLLDSLTAAEPAAESAGDSTLAATLPWLLLLACVGTFWRLERRAS